MSVEYWNKEKRQWLPSLGHTWEEAQQTNAIVGWEMYREAE